MEEKNTCIYQTNFIQSSLIEAVKHLGEAYNPLYLYGETGAGKTSMLHEVSNLVNEIYPDKKVCYTTARMIAEEIVEAHKKQGTYINKLKDKYYEIDVLLVDDIQYLMGKETTQKEFLKIFEPMCKCGKQIVVACDKYFENESALTDETRNFFASGLSSEIKPSDKP